MVTETELGGLHHVTAVTGNAARNLDFYTDVLGLRLVKKTVNQDDVSAYHLFYGDAEGHPGTELTFFDWPNAIQNRSGVGTVAATALRVSGPDSLAWWQERLERWGVTHTGIVERSGRASLSFNDPEGQALQLVDDGGAPGGTPWPSSPVPASNAIRGLSAVTLSVRRLEPTARLLTNVLGFRQVDTNDDAEPQPRVAIFEMGPGGPGAQVIVEEHADGRPGQVGRGGVHHVAFRTAGDTEQQAWAERLAQAGVPASPVIDRFYFRSLYFRDPSGGVLFEIATDGPGFASDEAAEHLGERLALPPFLEPHRQEIEAGLQPLDSRPKVLSAS